MGGIVRKSAKKCGKSGFSCVPFTAPGRLVFIFALATIQLFDEAEACSAEEQPCQGINRTNGDACLDCHQTGFTSIHLCWKYASKNLLSALQRWWRCLRLFWSGNNPNFFVCLNFFRHAHLFQDTLQNNCLRVFWSVKAKISRASNCEKAVFFAYSVFCLFSPQIA